MSELHTVRPVVVDPSLTPLEIDLMLALERADRELEVLTGASIIRPESWYYDHYDHYLSLGDPMLVDEDGNAVTPD